MDVVRFEFLYKSIVWSWVLYLMVEWYGGEDMRLIKNNMQQVVARSEDLYPLLVVWHILPGGRAV